MRKFIPKKSEKEVISLRISAKLLEQVDIQAAHFGISRNELIIQSIEYALANMADSDDETQDQQ